MVNSMQWQIATADLDYQYEQYEMSQFVIDRSDSMDEDVVRVPSEPKIKTFHNHKVRAKSVGADSWVDTYDKFLDSLFL